LDARDEETQEPIEEHDVVDTGGDRASGAHSDEAVERESRAAAEEAGAIGGDPGEEYGVEESERAVAEGGGGVSEGFEEAEHELVENATHEAVAPDPSELAGEPEDQRAQTEYGEADHERAQGDEDEPGPADEEKG
jgi:hypothetical protein